MTAVAVGIAITSTNLVKLFCTKLGNGHTNASGIGPAASCVQLEVTIFVRFTSGTEKATTNGLLWSVADRNFVVAAVAIEAALVVAPTGAVRRSATGVLTASDRVCFAKGATVAVGLKFLT